MNNITQEMKFRQTLMKYAEKYGVKRASRKYNKCRSYICFWRARWDGKIESLVGKFKRPHHPNEHSPDELKLIRNMRKRNPKLGITEFWHKPQAYSSYPPRHNEKVERSHREDHNMFLFLPHFSFLVTILINSLKIIFIALTTALCVLWVGFLL